MVLNITIEADLYGLAGIASLVTASFLIVRSYAVYASYRIARDKERQLNIVIEAATPFLRSLIQPFSFGIGLGRVVGTPMRREERPTNTNDDADDNSSDGEQPDPPAAAQEPVPPVPPTA